MVDIKRNPDKSFADEIAKALKANNGYCPCRSEKTPDTVCMCKEFREQEEGMCHCGLFIKTIIPSELDKEN